MSALPSRDDHDAPELPSARRSYTVWSDDPDDDRGVGERPVDANVRTQRVPRAPVLEGLTATGAAVIGLVGTSLGAVLDAAVSPGLGWLFFVTFVVMSAFVGLRLRGSDAWASVAVPPLLYITAAGLAAQVGAVTEGGWLRRTSGDMARAVLDHPYVLIIGTALAALAVLYRALID